MTEQVVVDRAFAMPITNPAYPPAPIRFVNRELTLITLPNSTSEFPCGGPQPGGELAPPHLFKG